MRRPLAALTVFLAAAVTGTASVTTHDLQNVLNRMEEAEKPVKSLAFHFVQDIRFTEMNAETAVTGDALVAKPNKLRIEKKQPEEQTTISDGNTLWVYNPAFKQVWQGKWQSWVNTGALPQGLVPIGGYVGDLKKKFHLSLENSADGVTINASPKDETLGYRLQLVVSTDTWLPTKTIFRSESGVVETKISDVKIDPPAEADQFRFTPPAGIDVIPLD